MLSNLTKSWRLWTACCAAIVVIVPLATKAAEKEVVLHGFHGGKDGASPLGSLIMDNAGNLYGTTVLGGGGGECGNFTDCGTVFKVSPKGRETILHTFIGGCDGANPRGGLVMDAAGNLYGTTQIGGICNNDAGFGTVFKLAPDGTETVLHAFTGDEVGDYPSWNLIIDGNGNLYGATEGGGQNQCCGVIFELSQAGQLNVLHTFLGGSDGAGPEGNMVMDDAGNIYGATEGGGGNGCNGTGCGTVFKLAPDGSVSIIYAFQGGTDGWYPQNGVVMDGSGNVYGTTWTGGGGGAGTVFEVTPTGTHSVLYSFLGGTDGGDPQAGVILDEAGNLYGTTYSGGDRTSCKDTGGCGVVFEVAPDSMETVLQAFNAKKDPRLGERPMAGLLLGQQGDLYGTTSKGGQHGKGVVFELKN